MAKRRILKKEIYYTFGDLFFDVLIYMHFQPDADKAKVELILSKISEANSEFICRAHHSPKGKDKKEIKRYYNKLYQELDNSVEQILKEIESLTNCPDK